MFTRKMGLGFEALGDEEGVENQGVVTDGVAVDDVIESGEGGSEVGELNSNIESVAASIEDMIVANDGLEETQTKIEEEVEANPTEVTGDTVAVAMEALTSAIAVSGIPFAKTSIGFESIVSNPKRALEVSLEDYKDFFARLWEQIKEFFKRLILGMKKVFTAVLKWTAADEAACDKLIDKIKESDTIEKISQKDGTFFNSTKTKIRKSLGGYLAAANKSNLVGGNFVSSLGVVMDAANDINILKDQLALADKVKKSTDMASLATIGGTLHPDYAKNFTDIPTGDNLKVLSTALSGNAISLVFNKKDKDDKVLVAETQRCVVKGSFLNEIEVSKVGKKELTEVLTKLKGHVKNSKKYFETADDVVTKIEAASSDILKDTKGDSAKTKWARLGVKVTTRIAKSGVYDVVISQIRVNKAILSVCKTIVNGKADDEK